MGFRRHDLCLYVDSMRKNFKKNHIFLFFWNKNKIAASNIVYNKIVENMKGDFIHMNKKILSGILAIHMLASAGAVFAENAETTPANDIMLISGTEAPVEVLEMQNAPQYIQVSGKITEMDELVTISDETGTICTLMHADGILIYDDQGKALTEADLTTDMEITVYINANSPAPLVMPPRYQPAVIIVHTGDAALYATSVDCFHAAEDRLAAQGGSLELHIAEETEIVTPAGEQIAADALDGKDLLVFYSTSTRSLPPQTTPEKVIVLPAAEVSAEPEAESDAPDFEKIYHKIVVNGTREINVDTDDTTVAGMVPVRAVAEALDLEVGWDSTLQAVTVGTVPMGVNFTVGTNSYSKARMMPFTLTKAPVQISLTDEEYVVTFVPIDFFTEVLGTQVSAEGETLKIDIAKLSVQE